ncbi:hypothetical protein DID78_03510 [Candidatus Marinamargulisbacteria bacterium SCGC AG-343-D04]|nr:hypothetical protein DID78_03510 [Candidatus Marinamargulisbacteria bacterium SCGC AG-343-D04]
MKYLLIFLMTFTLVGCSGPKQVTITIQPDGNKMAFLTTEFTVKANQEVKIVMDNTATIEVMKHNVVILNDESKINEVGQQALSSPGYLPNHSAIIAATPMAGAGEKTEVTFKAPSNPGEYVYICTFPGHYMMMKGKMLVN